MNVVIEVGFPNLLACKPRADGADWVEHVEDHDLDVGREHPQSRRLSFLVLSRVRLLSLLLLLDSRFGLRSVRFSFGKHFDGTVFDLD